MKYLILPLFLLLSLFAKAQCFPESHNTSWNEAWYSCDIDANPNPDRSPGHWIMYDFKNVYRLGKGRVWNINTPDRLTDGFQTFIVDYSVDGETWESLGLHHLDIGPGNNEYEGQELINFAGDSARYIVLSASSNYGGECFGIAEARFDVLDVAATLNQQIENGCFTATVYPNPHTDDFNFSLFTECGGSIEYRIVNPMSQILKEGTIYPNASGTLQQNINTQGLSPGTYLLYIRQNDNVEQYPIIKL